MRRQLPILPVIAILALSGCAADQPGEPGEPSEPPRNPDAPVLIGPGAEGESAALGLVNLWRVSDAEGADDDTWLRIEERDFVILGGCGTADGGWAATETLFLAEVHVATETCGLDTPVWLGSATGYRATADGWELTGSGGEVLATLTSEGSPPVRDTVPDHLTEPPEVTDAIREALRRPAPFPEALEPPSAEELVGRWVPVAYAVETDPHIDFAADGSWSGSDGCNGNAGRWAVDGEGSFLATSGFSTLIACEGAPVPWWVADARQAAVDGEWLLLLNIDGTEIGRLERG